MHLAESANITAESKLEPAKLPIDEAKNEPEVRLSEMLFSCFETAGSFLLEWLPNIISLYLLSAVDQTAGQL